MGKGSKQPQEQTVVQSNLPKYVRPYFERLLQRTEAESKQEYNPYTGQRLADEAADTLQARQDIRNLGPIAGIGDAQTATKDAIGRAQRGMGYEAEAFGLDSIRSKMTPFMQQVVEVQKAKAIQDFQDQNAAR